MIRNGIGIVNLKAKVCVKNRMGLHTRPATVIVKMLRKSKASVTFTHKKQTINAKSVLGILMLAARFKSVITISVEGEQAQETMDNLIQAFENQFDE